MVLVRYYHEFYSIYKRNCLEKMVVMRESRTLLNTGSVLYSTRGGAVIVHMY